MAERYRHPHRVRYRECDQQGVVFNGHYFSWFDDVLTEAFRDVLVPYNDMLETGVDVVVAEARARYLGGARFEDELDLVWWVTRLGNTAMTTRLMALGIVRDSSLASSAMLEIVSMPV